MQNVIAKLNQVQTKATKSTSRKTSVPTPRPYQEEMLGAINDARVRGIREIVIAACPASGKTLITMLDMIRNPFSKYLVLTHGQTTLRDQWYSEFKKLGLEASVVPGKARITFGLPHMRHKYSCLKGKIDTLVIDEAHQFTFAKMVQDIIKDVKPKLIVYLTGTPSKLIQRGYEVHCIPATELVEAGYMADVHFGLLTSKVRIKNRDFNTEGDLKRSANRKLERTVDSDLDSLLEAIKRRVREVEGSDANVSMRKTLIACQSIKQATRVARYFNKKGIKSKTSNSENDLESSIMSEFQTDPLLKILTVVGRGILGFNYPDLAFTVDLTGTRNIDRIYQLYARAMRKSEVEKHKYFFKFTPEDQVDVMKFYYQAAMMLMHKPFLLKFNGKNLNGMEVPNVKQVSKPLSSKSSMGSERSKVSVKLPSDEFFRTTVGGVRLLRDVIHKNSDGVHEIAWVTLGEAVSKLIGIRHVDPESKKLRLLNMARDGHPKPIQKIHPLGYSFNLYCNPKRSTYDPDFVREVKQAAPSWFERRFLLKDLLLKISSEGKKVPKESILASTLSQLTNSKSDRYDRDFHEKILIQSPDWLKSKLDKSLDRFLTKIPGNVRYIKTQTWKGMNKKHKFIDVDYGQFEAKPNKLTQRTWPLKLTGHPKRSRLASISAREKSVINIDTGWVYPSGKKAANLKKIRYKSLNQCLRNRSHTSGGERWAYYDPKKHKHLVKKIIK